MTTSANAYGQMPTSQHTFSSSFSQSASHNLGLSSGGRPAPVASFILMIWLLDKRDSPSAAVATLLLIFGGFASPICMLCSATVFSEIDRCWLAQGKSPEIWSTGMSNSLQVPKIQFESQVSPATEFCCRKNIYCLSRKSAALPLRCANAPDHECQVLGGLECLLRKIHQYWAMRG